jgi:hypothetical protein
MYGPCKPCARLRLSYSCNFLLYRISKTTSFLFDICSYVQRRNEKVILAAARSTAIVSSLFPSNIRDRLYKDQEEQQEKQRHKAGNLKNFLRDGGNNMIDGISDTQFSSKPLADLFPETTVLVGSKK